MPTTPRRRCCLKAAIPDAVSLPLYPKATAVILRDAAKLTFKPLTIRQAGICDPPALGKQVGVPGATATSSPFRRCATRPTIPPSPSGKPLSQTPIRILLARQEGLRAFQVAQEIAFGGLLLSVVVLAPKSVVG